MLGFGDGAGSNGADDTLHDKAFVETNRMSEPEKSGPLLRGAKQLGYRGSEIERGVILTPPDSSDELSAQVLSPAPINVGVYIDPEEVPFSAGAGVNIGTYIDPEALPEYSAREVNVGSFIDPESLPQGSAVRVNYGVYLDPDAPRVEAIGNVNIGPALTDPTP